MNSRERVLCAISHTKPDRTPTDLQATKEVWDKLRKHFNTTDYDKILEKLSIDCRWIGPEYIGPTPITYSDGTYEGWGGSLLKKAINEYGTYEEVVKFILDTVETRDDIDNMIKLPNLNYYDFSTIGQQCKKHGDKFVLSGMASTFYYPTLIRSMENILMDMIINPELAHYLFKKCTDWHMDYHERLLCAGKGRIDALQIADDFSTQLDLIMSPEMYKTYFSEAIKKYAELGKSYGAKIFLHCCGSAYKLIPEFIQAGIEILDPIQTTAANMSPSKLKKEFGNKLTFHGAVNTQKTLPLGTTEEVKNEVKELVNILGKDGGYILTSCHCLQPDVPIENILELYDISNR